MSSRQWLSSALRQAQTVVSRPAPLQKLSISTTSPAAALRNIPSNQASLLVDLANNNNNNGPQVSANDALLDYMPNGQRRPGGHNNLNSNGDGGRRVVQEMAQSSETDSYVKMIARRWKKGDTYAPRDLSPVEMRRWKHWNESTSDAVDLLGFNPLDNYRNFSLISEFMTPFGRIMSRRESGLRPVNQRKMAKAIRRAIALGLHPSVHKHPQLLIHRRGGMGITSQPSTPLDPSKQKL
ncbi:ribosomal protein S18 [Lasiosphaeria hispida]|uniref:Small ribosomal subunit protein bS18m n=1 Tax=Lasiosphaeria hispida TaxID=260671 RepID=A0AAJ0MIB0_9PEZI|nr:ribosomal protein S18 [Lasiosphaeria hispida]